MTPDEARNVAHQELPRIITCARSKSADAAFEMFAAALLAACARQREEDARIADNFAKRADAKKPRDDIVDAEHIICTRIAAAIREQKP